MNWTCALLNHIKKLLIDKEKWKRKKHELMLMENVQTSISNKQDNINYQDCKSLTQKKHN